MKNHDTNLVPWKTNQEGINKNVTNRETDRTFLLYIDGIQGVRKRTDFQNAAGATVHWLNHHLPAPLVSGEWFFGRFLLRLSKIKRPQVMSMVKFSPITLNFRYDFVLFVIFFGTPCKSLNGCFIIKTNKGFKSRHLQHSFDSDTESKFNYG